MTDLSQIGIDHLELSVRASNVLRGAGVADMASFMSLTRPDVLRMKHAGAKTWDEIEEIQESLRRSRTSTQVYDVESALRVVNATLIDDLDLHLVRDRRTGLLVLARVI